MATPKSVRERLHRKLRLTNRGRTTARKTRRDRSMIGRVVPKKSGDNDPIRGFGHVKEAFDALYHARGGAAFRDVIDRIDESIFKDLLIVTNRLITMSLSGWGRGQCGMFIHESGTAVSGRYGLSNGRLMTEDGRQLAIDAARLHEMRMAFEKTINLLELERKLDLFGGVRGML